jgi:glycyl-tRNA synthetase
VQETTRRKLPFGIAQIGKAFRNEITVKQFMFRTREFEQMDVEYFVRPGTEDTHYAYFKQNRWDFYTQALQVNPENLKFRQHDKDELVFYAKEAWDVEYNFGENGFKELEGIHNRTDYDTKQHSKFSGQDLTYFDPEDNTRYLPYIIETSAGFTRMFLATLFEFYTEEELVNPEITHDTPSPAVPPLLKKGNGETRIVLKLPYNLAPYKLAILPLMKKDGLGEMAFELYAKLRKLGISVDYDESGSIGKRYRRQDENGTPFCATLDYDTKEKGTLTIRHRDSMSQEVIQLDKIEQFLSNKST